MDVTSCIAKLREITELITLADAKRASLIKALKSDCAGNCGNIVVHEDYFPGDYYNRETWVSYKKCPICGWRGESKHTTGGYG